MTKVETTFKIAMKSKSRSNSNRQASRRAFTKTVASTLLAAPLASRMGAAQKQTSAKEAAAPPSAQSAAQAQSPSPVAEAYLAVARARFKDQLTPEQLEQVRKDLEANLQAAERLRAAKLRNEDEPDFIFSAE